MTAPLAIPGSAQDLDILGRQLAHLNSLAASLTTKLREASKTAPTLRRYVAHIETCASLAAGVRDEVRSLVRITDADRAVAEDARS